MPSLRFGLRLCFALIAVVASAASGRAESTPGADERPASNQANIVLIGAAGRDLELKALLSELLERRAVQARISRQDEFGRDQLLHAEFHGGVLVFVVPGPDGNVGLYFRAPDGERFLLRSVHLRAGFDDVGRELVGQVVETAVGSLLHSRDGLTREQARLALANEGTPTPNTSTSDAVAKATPEPPARRVQRTPQATSGGTPLALDGWLALRYGMVALGRELGVAHGPGLELGLGVTHRYSLRARLIGERDFPQSLSTPLIAAELTRTRLRLAADAGFELTERQLLSFSLGIGQDRLTVRPGSASGSSVAPKPSFEAQAPVALTELRYEVALARFRLVAAVGADISLVRTHYDVVQPTQRESVGSPWLIRPSASLALAFCPTLGRL